MTSGSFHTTDATLKGLSELYRRVANISDGLGSEATTSGQVIPTHAHTFSQAIAFHFPKSYASYPLTRADFDAKFGTIAGVRDLLSLLGKEPMEAALVGGDQFRPSAHDRGEFWVCLFSGDAAAFGSHVLIRFERAET